MKYIGYYTQQRDYRGEFTRDWIDEMHKYDFLKLMNDLKDIPASEVKGIFVHLLRAFPENKNRWINKTLVLLKKHRNRWPEYYYEDLYTWLIAVQKIIKNKTRK